jgi:hypothetical protein
MFDQYCAMISSFMTYRARGSKQVSDKASGLTVLVLCITLLLSGRVVADDDARALAAQLMGKWSASTDGYKKMTFDLAGCREGQSPPSARRQPPAGPPSPPALRSPCELFGHGSGKCFAIIDSRWNLEITNYVSFSGDPDFDYLSDEKPESVKGTMSASINWHASYETSSGDPEHAEQMCFRGTVNSLNDQSRWQIARYNVKIPLKLENGRAVLCRYDGPYDCEGDNCHKLGFISLQGLSRTCYKLSPSGIELSGTVTSNLVGHPVEFTKK